MEAAVIIERSLPLWYAVIICGLFYSFITTWDGKVLKGFAVAFVVVSLAILLTDLRSKELSIIERFDFNGVIYSETVETNYTMPVYEPADVNYNTGVITGGYENAESSIESL